MWVKELRKMVGKDICISIAGNKSDLERNRQVSTEEAERYAASVDATYFNTSAKLNRGIDDAFLDLAKRMLAAKKKGSFGGGGDGLGGGQSWQRSFMAESFSISSPLISDSFFLIITGLIKDGG